MKLKSIQPCKGIVLGVIFDLEKENKKLQEEMAVLKAMVHKN